MRPETQRLILDPTGIPRNGLAGMWIPALDFDGRNLLAWSEAFDNAAWTKYRATISANSVTAPDGMTTADSLVEDATEASQHNMYTTTAFTNGVTYVLSIYAKADTRYGLVIGLPATPLGAHQIKVNLTAGTVSVRAGSPPIMGIQSVGNGWYRIYVGATATSTASGVVGFNLSNDNGTTITYNGDNASGIYIWGAQVNPGSLQPYNPTTDKQVLFDRSGGNFHGQLGATTGAEASDPRWDPDGLYYTTNDYVNLDTSKPVYGPAYTVLAVVKGAAQDAKSMYSEGRAASANPLLSIGTGTTGTSKLRVAIANDAASSLLAVESTAVALDGGWHLVGLRDIGGAYTMFIDGAKESGAYAQGALTLDRCTLGSLGKNTYNAFLAGSIPALIRWERGISDAEYERTRRELRRMLAPSGITLP